MTQPALTLATYRPSVQSGQSFGLCIFGRGGTGKTSLLATMPGSSGLVIDVPQFEGGTFVLSSVADHVEITPCEEFKDIDKIYKYLQQMKHTYKWVSVDSITGMQELAKRRVIGERDIAADPHVISLQEWGKIGRLISELVFNFRKLSINTIWIAQERTNRPDNAPATCGPDLTPSALAALVPAMTLVGRLSVEETDDGKWERRLRIGPHNYYTSTKYRALPGIDMPVFIRNPNLAQILRYMFNLPNATRPEEVVESTGFSFSPIG